MRESRRRRKDIRREGLTVEVDGTEVEAAVNLEAALEMEVEKSRKKEKGREKGL